MNRQKSAPRTRPSTYAAMILTGVIIAGGGMLHADYKYRQIKVTREIAAGLLREAADKGSIDVVQDVSAPLPILPWHTPGRSLPWLSRPGATPRAATSRPA